jgi:hypothetical protein
MRAGGPAMADAKTDHKCAHPSCSCNVPAGTKYCSDYCKKAPEIELHCNCMHPDCSHR